MAIYILIKIFEGEKWALVRCTPINTNPLSYAPQKS